MRLLWGPSKSADGIDWCSQCSLFCLPYICSYWPSIQSPGMLRGQIVSYIATHIFAGNHHLLFPPLFGACVSMYYHQKISWPLSMNTYNYIFCVGIHELNINTGHSALKIFHCTVSMELHCSWTILLLQLYLDSQPEIHPSRGGTTCITKCWLSMPFLHWLQYKKRARWVGNPWPMSHLLWYPTVRLKELAGSVTFNGPQYVSWEPQ